MGKLKTKIKLAEEETEQADSAVDPPQIRQHSQVQCEAETLAPYQAQAVEWQRPLCAKQHPISISQSHHQSQCEWRIANSGKMTGREGKLALLCAYQRSDQTVGIACACCGCSFMSSVL